MCCRWAAFHFPASYPSSRCPTKPAMPRKCSFLARQALANIRRYLISLQRPCWKIFFWHLEKSKTWSYFSSEKVHFLQNVTTWKPGQLFFNHYTSTLHTIHHSNPIIKRVISHCVHCRHYAIMTPVDLTSGWKAHACGFDYFEVNFIHVRGRFASVLHCTMCSS